MMTPLSERLWRKVAKIGPDECWLWGGARAASGRRGHIGRGRRGEGNIESHRAAYEVTFGAVPDGLEVCHRCDNGLCCNPAHLFLASHKGNMLDMARKGRQPNRKLTWDRVRAIRAQVAAGLSKADVGRKFGVSRVQVANIVSNRQWVEAA